MRSLTRHLAGLSNPIWNGVREGNTVVFHESISHSALFTTFAFDLTHHLPSQSEKETCSVMRKMGKPVTRWKVKQFKLTFLVHFLTVLINSCITRSTLFKEGPFSFTICFLTIASNAMSGVNNPVLNLRKKVAR